ncbi:hypothetical protein M0813_26921 [Anaeramoeba flamelloides]|uniref:Uncharacterized protein n=1 Tax=Anaeramoeba flamelloides TaxID=1746091 RepID=A0ABQ8XZJ4_9EUKA|nr:hypothetical protein M0813_26921 [Anaeramoeba flamelloides]
MNQSKIIIKLIKNFKFLFFEKIKKEEEKRENEKEKETRYTNEQKSIQNDLKGNTQQNRQNINIIENNTTTKTRSENLFKKGRYNLRKKINSSFFQGVDNKSVTHKTRNNFFKKCHSIKTQLMEDFKMTSVNNSKDCNDVTWQPKNDDNFSLKQNKTINNIQIEFTDFNIFDGLRQNLKSTSTLNFFHDNEPIIKNSQYIHNSETNLAHTEMFTNGGNSIQNDQNELTKNLYEHDIENTYTNHEDFIQNDQNDINGICDEFNVEKKYTTYDDFIQNDQNELTKNLNENDIENMYTNNEDFI